MIRLRGAFRLHLPGVNRCFWDGNLSRELKTADLEARQAAGIPHVLFPEMKVDGPRGPLECLSKPWWSSTTKSPFVLDDNYFFRWV